MYNDKVMEHFQNPKNLKEIKNPDGTGKVGNPVCLLPEEKIHTDTNVISIDKLKKGQQVLTHKGNYEKIFSVFSRRYNGKIIILKNKLGKINLTPEHLIYAVKIQKGDKFLRNKGKKKLIPSWHHAEQLSKGDIILYPILKEEKDLDYLEINIQKPKWDFRSKEIPNKISLNSDLLRLFGYFLSEGNIRDKPCKTYLSFTLNIKEKDIVEDIRKICKKLFGLDIKTKELPKRKTAIVYVYNAKLARFFKQLFGNGASNKNLPEFIIDLPIKKQKHLIYGLWKGDGYINLNRVGPRGGYVTISYQLAQQVKTLLLRQNIASSIYLDKERIINGVNHKTSYRIHVGQRDSLNKLCKIMNIKYSPKSYESIKSWFDNDFLYTPITGIEKRGYNGDVYNLEVENSHSFVSDAFCLHNCGDVLWLYIKVEKNKQGEDYIKDIGVKTFGCVAAIATSSAVTELAKGKTLEEAKKITRDSIGDVLDGLPPIKIHCSNLSADALHKAIEDYEGKK